MGEISLSLLAKEYWHIGLVAVTLVGLAIDFLWRFLYRSRVLAVELSKAIAALRSISTQSGELTELDEVASKAMASHALTHLWSEYVKTLHPQRIDDGTGQSRIVRWRSTALAETFFSEQVIVDGRLKTEFFKHLPGVLTGLGIIGTFAGLIKGLVNFNVDVDPTKAQEQLQALVNSVGHAFYVSASAIGLAMLFTWIEKSVVTARYHQVEELRELIDSLFRGGAGEEYLERLVMASETSATQAAHIKDALVADLKEILSSLTAQQIQAQAQHSGQLSADVSKSISETLTGPMEAITKAVQNVSSNQGEAVNKMLTDVLASFGSQLKDMFGGQMQGMTDLMLKASEAMQATAVQFGQLAANMDAAGTHTVDAMGEKLAKALDNMDARQAAMNLQMGTFVEQIKNLVSQSQSETNEKLREAVTTMGGQAAGVVEQLRKQAEDSAESQEERARRFEESTGQAIGSLSGQVEHVMLVASEALQSTAVQFGKIAANMDAAGTNTVDAMGEKLAKALDNMDARQAAMNGQMGAFVEQIKSLVSQSQTETNEKLREALTAVGGQVSGVVEQLRRQAEASAESQGERSRRFEESTGQAIGSLSGQVEQLLAQSMETNKSLQASVSSLSAATDKAITGLNSGVDTLFVAVDDFAKAGQGVADTMKASTVATEAIRGASTQLTMATENAKGVFADYAKTRDMFATMISDLKGTFDTAKRDASMTSDLIRQIEGATKQLAQAQRQSEDYLKGVSEVLVKAHDSFRENVERTLGEGNRKFQSELSSAVQLLSGAIKNLGDVVDDIPTRR